MNRQPERKMRTHRRSSTSRCYADGGRRFRSSAKPDIERDCREYTHVALQCEIESRFLISRRREAVAGVLFPSDVGEREGKSVGVSLEQLREQRALTLASIDSLVSNSKGNVMNLSDLHVRAALLALACVLPLALPVAAHEDEQDDNNADHDSSRGSQAYDNHVLVSNGAVAADFTDP